MAGNDFILLPDELSATRQPVVEYSHVKMVVTGGLKQSNKYQMLLFKPYSSYRSNVRQHNVANYLHQYLNGTEVQTELVVQL